jgi:hypothetical protein
MTTMAEIFIMDFRDLQALQQTKSFPSTPHCCETEDDALIDEFRIDDSD